MVVSQTQTLVRESETTSIDSSSSTTIYATSMANLFYMQNSRARSQVNINSEHCSPLAVRARPEGAPYTRYNSHGTAGEHGTGD